MPHEYLRIIPCAKPGACHRRIVAVTDLRNSSGPEFDLRTDQVRVSLLGHDLRAAVSDVIGGLRLIDLDLMEQNARLQLERVRAAAEVLARLLEQELALLQGEPAFPEVMPENVHISRLLNDLKVRWAGRAQEKGLDFTMSVGPTVPQVVKFERTALDRVMSNVLSNAVKYTDQGTVSFDVDLAADGALQFVVEDEGPGFSAMALQSLFVLGERVDGHGKPGLGLGLRISKDMADRLGGDITVENRAGLAGTAATPAKGARVTVSLPAAVWEAVHSDRVLNPKLPDLSKIRVLLADDSPTNQAVIGAMLSAMGAEYQVASDGVEAMTLLDHQEFDLALLDIEMPRLTGLEVLRLVRARPGRAAQVPVLAITAYVLRANREAIYAAGADGILAKPVMCIEAFGKAITRAVGRMGQVPADGSVPSTADPSQPEINRTRFDHLMTIAGPVAAQELLSRLETDLRRVERGLVGAVAAANLAELRGQTHVLIALAGAVGATPLQNMAERLNDFAHHGDLANARDLSALALQHMDRLIHFISNELAQRQQSR